MRWSPSSTLALTLLGRVLMHSEVLALDIRKLFRKDKSMNMNMAGSKGSASAQLVTQKQAKASEARKITTSCDRDMAKSLVVLSEQKEIAEAAHDDCLEILSTAYNETEFWKNQVALGEEDCKAQINQMELQVNASRRSAEMRVDAVKERLRETKEEFELQTSEMDRLVAVHAKELKNLTKTAEVRQADLTEELEGKCDKRVADVQLTSDKLHNEAQAVVVELKQKLKEGKLEKEAQRTAMDEEKQKLVDDHMAEIEAIQSGHKEAAEKLSQTAAKKLQATKESMELVVKERDETILSLKDKVAELEDELSEVKKSRKQLEKDYKKAMKDLEAWEAMYSHRSYCNITHVAEDAVLTANSAANSLLVLADEMLQILSQQFQVYVAKPTEKWCRPHVTKVQTWYAKNIEPNYNKYLQSHVAVARGKISELSETTMHNLAISFLKSCPQSLEFLRSQEGVPPQVIQSVESACQKPNETVRGFLTALLVLFLFGFRSTILSLLFLPFRIFTLPMRLLNGRKRNIKESPESPRKISQ